MDKHSRKYTIGCYALLGVGGAGLAVALLHDHVSGQTVHYGFSDIFLAVFSATVLVVGLAGRLLPATPRMRETLLRWHRVRPGHALLCGALLGASGTAAVFLGPYRDWSSGGTDEIWSIGIYESRGNEPVAFDDRGIANPVLTSADVTDVRAVGVADPFLLHDGDQYVMFFEVINTKFHGDIGLATSRDGRTWSYRQIVLDEPFSLSFPWVFKWQDTYWMVPDARATQSVRLYKADPFPCKWSYVKTLLTGRKFKDSMVFPYQDRWWLLTETANNDVLRLYLAETPLGPWVEHERSPIVEGDANIARGAGIAVFDDRIVRYAQDCQPYYGNQVWAFEITALSPQCYEERCVLEEPILKGFDDWNTAGMHTLSPCRLEHGRWIAAVDGKDKGW